MPDNLLDVVDDNDCVVGTASRAECHEKKLTHRSVMFFIFNKQGQVLVTRRTMYKEFYPGARSIALGGHVDAGESYADAAAREIEEETGIAAIPVFIGGFQKRIPEESENVQVFGAIADRPPALDREEIEEGRFTAIDKLEKLVERDEFLPETGMLYRLLKKHLGRD